MKFKQHFQFKNFQRAAKLSDMSPNSANDPSNGVRSHPQWDREESVVSSSGDMTLPKGATGGRLSHPWGDPHYFGVVTPLDEVT